MARDPYRYFRIEARDLADKLGRSVLELEKSGSGGEVVPRLLRLAHTLKGAARVVRLSEIAEQAHGIEDLLAPFRDASRPVPAESIDALLQLLDGIATGLDALALPALAEGDAAPARPEPGGAGSIAAIGDDSSEIDSILEGVVAAAAAMGALDGLGDRLAEARDLANQVVEQAALGRRAAALVSEPAEALRGILAGLERALGVTRERVERDLRQIHESAEQLRLVPASAIFAVLERAARDAAQLLHKEVGFEARGGDIRLDGQVVRLVQDAAVQLIRNAVAHGIEVPRERVAAGKPASGRISVSVARRGRTIVFRCEDDGRGIDISAIRDAAQRKGRALADPSGFDRFALARWLVESGVSTSVSVSEVAGRGIGMDVVRDTVARLAAGFSVETLPTSGTAFELTVPLSLSSVDSLVVESSGGKASMPLSAVRRAARCSAADVVATAEGPAIVDEGRTVPLVYLSELLGRQQPLRRTSGFTAVIIATSAGTAALGVGRISGIASRILRPLPELAPAAAVVAGASFSVDGTALLMLDPDAVVGAALTRRQSVRTPEAAKRPLLVIDDSLTTRMLEQSILQSAGYEVDVAVSAEEGLERIARRDYALILVDVEMPGMDGFGFIETLRRNSETKDIPAIMVTSRNAPEDRRRGMDAGAQDYVAKSEFDQSALLERIRELVT